LQVTHDRLAAVDSWTAEPLEAALRGLAAERGLAPGKVFAPLRLALTGATVSPGIFDVLVMMERDRALRRIQSVVDRLRAV
jgi:glutamyl-tRNA synthetase